MTEAEKMFPAIRFIYLPYFVEFDIIAYGNRIKERYGNDRIFFKVSEIHFLHRHSANRKSDGGKLNMKRSSFFSAKNIAYLAVLTALVVVLQTVGGVITIGTVQLNFTLIPIVVGAILLGPLAGAFLGFVCGIIVMIYVIIGAAPFYAVIWANNPVMSILTCVVKTTAAGFAAGWIYRWLGGKNRFVAVFVASGSVPVINSALFILGCLCMSGTINIFQNAEGVNAGGMNVLLFILVVLVGFNFFIEFALNLLLAPAICRVEAIVNRRVAARKTAPQVPQAEIPNGEDSPNDGKEE